MSKNQHGGKRPGSGPKLKYGEELICLNIKVPKSRKTEIKTAFRKILEKYILKK